MAPSPLPAADGLGAVAAAESRGSGPGVAQGFGRLVAWTWGLARPYWTSDERWRATLLLVVLVATNVGLVYLNVVFTRWNNVFYNALQDRNAAVFGAQLLRFSGLAAVFIVVTVYQLYLNQMLQIRWRRWITDRYLGTWLAGQAYYHLQVDGRDADNPDQRIADDVRLFVAGSLTLSLGALSALVTLASFAVILWRLSGTLRVPLGGGILSVPGYMVWLALVYAVAGTGLTARIGRRLTALNYDQQRFEADFRVALVRLRENAEGVAFHRGEADELAGFRARFGEVVRNWWGIMRRQKQLGWFTAGYNQVAVVFPFLMAAPRYFSGAIPLGGLVQTALAFAQVQQALSFVVNAYPDIAEWRAVVERLVGFQASIMRIQAVPPEPGIRVVDTAVASLIVDRVTLRLPDGRRLLREVTFTLHPGDTVLLAGPSGSGKSTLMRAIAGLWPFGAGTILLPPEARTMFVPQKPYLPVGTLREAVSYPRTTGDAGDERVRDAFRAVGLSHLLPRLEEVAHWSQQLSVGEQQRVAFARVLAQRPEWLFLDEATSALAEAEEADLYRLLRRWLPGAAVLSVGHRSTLRAFHARHWAIVAVPGGAARLDVVDAGVREVSPASHPEPMSEVHPRPR